jgi:septal ring-binding cell division protein DamX
VVQFIEMHRLQDKTAYFPIKRKGQVLYALVYGDYPNAAEAARAAKALPAAWGTPDPWARTFKSLRGEFGR